MTTTDTLPYPILLRSRKYFLFQFKKSPDELVWEKGSLKRFQYFREAFIIDNQLRKHEIVTSHVVGGHGFLSGYFLQGPFLARNVVFRSDVSFIEQGNLRSVAEMIAEFMKDSQSVRNDDVARFWAAFESFERKAEQTLSALETFYSLFQWGDDLPSE
jgi:hypothetical protein